MGWMIESSADPMAAGIAAARGGQDAAAAAAAAGANPRNYRPSPADMTNLTLSKDMMNLAERLSEDAHDTQALQRIRKVAFRTCVDKLRYLCSSEGNIPRWAVLYH